MTHARPTRRRLVAAVTAVLAVTLGTTALAVPATAAPAAEGTTTGGTAAQDVIAFPRGDKIFGATSSGFLTSNSPGGGALFERRWVPLDGSTPKKLSSSNPLQSTGSGNLVGTRVGSDAILLDVSTGREVTRTFLGPRETLRRYVGAAGQALFTTSENGTGGHELHLHRSVGETLVTGLPAGAEDMAVRAGTADHGLLTYSTGAGTEAKRFLSLVDVNTGVVTETYPLPAAAANGDIAVSATHVAWVETTPANRATVVVLDRSTGRDQRILLADEWVSDLEVGLVGDWVTYGERGALANGAPGATNALTARNLTDGKTTVKLLDHLTSAAAAPDGTQAVRGGTIAQGEGVYRIAPGSDGVPAATLVAGTGEQTKLTLVDHNVPSTIDLDANGGRVPLVWNLSRGHAEVKVTLRHTRTGKATVAYLYDQPDTPTYAFDWEGDLDWARSAYNGAYTWELSAKPLNGIGPDLTASGSFKIVRKPAPHDYDDNGSPDVLLRDASGRLIRVDTYYSPYINTTGQLVEAEKKVIGSGWNIYDQIEAAGNVAGAPAGDIVARDRAGILWLYLGKGDGTFATRTKVGAGWGVYNKITGGSDLNNDGKADLLATDAAGGLYLYKGTGSATAPFSARVKIGHGWGIYNQITAVGNIAGAPAGDLVARDKNGVLWSYLGKGDGTFAARTRIGGGWNTYSHLVGVGDANRDGRNDLYAYTPGTEYSMGSGSFYQGTGSWRAPFKGRELTGVDGALTLSPTVA
ncbi:FG-GAP repeat domain-containing protein [Streptomyces sp. NPDC058579]|uniref:FG-GAP repeat domain-containing protein n=1 Tax=Streptomyces sp. NPDC058579 TaxID=3346548 RepID=UPI0036585BDB